MTSSVNIRLPPVPLLIEVSNASSGSIDEKRKSFLAGPRLSIMLTPYLRKDEQEFACLEGDYLLAKTTFAAL